MLGLGFLMMGFLGVTDPPPSDLSLGRPVFPELVGDLDLGCHQYPV